SVNIGYGYGEEMGEAAPAQMRELPFYTNWSYAHPRAIELADEVASLTPGDLNRLFFVSGGSEAGEAAWKLARPDHPARGEEGLRRAGRAALGDRACSVGAVPRLRRGTGGDARRRAALEGDLPAHRLSRDDDGCAVDQRDPRAPDAVRAARPGGAARPQHE